MITDRSTALFTTNGHPTSRLHWNLMPPPSDPRPGPSNARDEVPQTDEETSETSTAPATDSGLQTQNVALN